MGKRKREIYVWQIEPGITKKEGEPGYAIRSCAPVSLDMISDRLPLATRVKIMQKVRGDRSRKIWMVALVPKPAAPAGATQSAGVGSDAVAMLNKGAEMLKATTAISETAMGKSVEIMGDAYRQAVQLQAKPGESTADVLVKMKELGLLKSDSGFDFEKAKGFLSFGVELLKSAGVVGGAPKEAAKNKLGEISEILDFFESRGMRGAAAETSPWMGLLTTLAPAALRSLENVTANLTRIMELRLAGTAVTSPAAAAASPAQPALPSTASAPPAASVPPGATPASQEQNIGNWIKQNLVALYKAGYTPRRVAQWVEMTAPGLIAELAKVPDAVALTLFNADPILQQLGQDAQATEFKAELLKRLKAAKPAEPAASGDGNPEAGSTTSVA